MKAKLEYGENHLVISDFRHYESEVRRGNPYNTAFTLDVSSEGFCGRAACEYDIRSFADLVRDLHRMYCFDADCAVLEEICYGSRVAFEMDRLGHLAVSGTIYGVAMEQQLKFRFRCDQTALGLFLESLDDFIR